MANIPAKPDKATSAEIIYEDGIPVGFKVEDNIVQVYGHFAIGMPDEPYYIYYTPPTRWQRFKSWLNNLLNTGDE